MSFLFHTSWRHDGKDWAEPHTATTLEQARRQHDHAMRLLWPQEGWERHTVTPLYERRNGIWTAIKAGRANRR